MRHSIIVVIAAVLSGIVDANSEASDRDTIGEWLPVSMPEIRAIPDSNDIAILLPLTGEPGEWSISVNGTDISLDVQSAEGGYLAIYDQLSLPSAISFIVVPPSGYADMALLEWVSPSFRQLSSQTLTPPAFEERSLESAYLESQRQYYFYRSPVEPETELAGLILTGDGLAAGMFGSVATDLFERGLIRPIAIASTHPSMEYLPEARTDGRSAEYVPTARFMERSADTARENVFRMHQLFFEAEFRQAVQDEFFGGEPLPPLYAAGISASGTFALVQLLENRTDYQAGFAGSPPFPTSLSNAISQAENLPSVLVYCGTLEGALCTRLRTALGSSAVTEANANHTDALWEEGFALFLLTHFGRNRPSSETD